MLAISCASTTSPPPLPRRSKHDALGALRGAPVRPLRGLPRARPGVKAASATTPSFSPLYGARLGGHDGLGDDRARDAARCACAVRAPWPAAGASIPSTTSVPGSPLISAMAASADRPASLRPLTATITSPLFRPARAAGEELNTRAISSPGCFRADRDADPGEVRRLDRIPGIRRGEVVGEAVVEARDHPARARRSPAASRGSAGNSRTRSASSASSTTASGGLLRLPERRNPGKVSGWPPSQMPSSSRPSAAIAASAAGSVHRRR